MILPLVTWILYFIQRNLTLYRIIAVVWLAAVMGSAFMNPEMLTPVLESVMIVMWYNEDLFFS